MEDRAYGYTAVPATSSRLPKELDASENGDEQPSFDFREYLKHISPRKRLLAVATATIWSLACIFAGGFMTYQTSISDARCESYQLKKSPVPSIPLKIRTFQPEPAFSEPFSPSAPADDWSALIPQGKGFVHVANPSLYGLEPGQLDSLDPLNRTTYSLSVFHQIHCLGMIRKRFFVSSEKSKGFGDGAPPGETHLGDEHIGHRFDYLRQGIMCAGDMTLEWPKTEDNGARAAVDGWGMDHVCRNWDAILSFVDQEGFKGKGSKGID